MALKCKCGGEIRKTIDNKDECIICGNTIKIDEPAQIPEQTYVEIAETFGKQFRDAIRKSYSEGYADGFKQAKFDAEMERAIATMAKATSKYGRCPNEIRKMSGM